MSTALILCLFVCLSFKLLTGSVLNPDYTMQSDAHVTYANNWDIDIINQLESTKNEMAVLSTYLSNYSDKALNENGDGIYKARPIMCCESAIVMY